MGKERENNIKEYVGDVLTSLGSKTRARERDILGFYGEEILTEEEEIIYEYYVKQADFVEYTYIKNEYIDALGLTNRQLWSEMGISENTFYKVRSVLLLKLNDLMEQEYCGYSNRSQNLPELPYKLNMGTYIRYGDFFNYTDLDDEIYAIGVGEQEIVDIESLRVVKDTSLILDIVKATEIVVGNPSVIDCFVVNDGFAGTGVIASIKLGGYEFLGDVLEDIQKTVRIYEDENGLNILQNDVVLDFIK